MTPDDHCVSALALAEALDPDTPHPFRATPFPSDDGYDQLIVARAIPFHSLCMHHLLPFHGVAHIGYLSGERTIGLSKLGRVGGFFSRDLQIQERLTMHVADWLRHDIESRGVGSSWRPVLHGLVRDDPPPARSSWP
jgi:GTP cyclohydrolase I